MRLPEVPTPSHAVEDARAWRDHRLVDERDKKLEGSTEVGAPHSPISLFEALDDLPTFDVKSCYDADKSYVARPVRPPPLLPLALSDLLDRRPLTRPSLSSRTVWRRGQAEKGGRVRHDRAHDVPAAVPHVPRRARAGVFRWRHAPLVPLALGDGRAARPRRQDRRPPRECVHLLRLFSVSLDQAAARTPH